MRILVTVASKHGSTREIAETIAQELQESGLMVDLRKVGEVTLVAGYDAVILGRNAVRRRKSRRSPSSLRKISLPK